MVPTPASEVRQNIRPECEAAVNSHAALEFHASFQCLAVAFYLNRDDVALRHFSRLFLLRSHEHSKTAESLMFLQKERGGRVSFLDLRKPQSQEWGSGLQAMQDTLHLEKCVNQSLHNLIKLVIESCATDLHLSVGIGYLVEQVMGNAYLVEQVKFIKDLEDLVSKLSNAGSPEGALEEYFEKLTLGHGNKED